MFTMEREKLMMEDVPRLSERGIGALGGRVILASRSPRRTWLLGLAGITHETMLPGFEDGVLVPGKVPGMAVPIALAYLKAWAVAERLGNWGKGGSCGSGGRLVIGADTACAMDGELIGTPTNAAEAQEMIRAFMDQEHEVLTGVALLREGSKRDMFVDRARVWMGRLSEVELMEYVASGAWQGKAGGYNLLDRLNAGWPLRYEGDPTTIMGLPMKRLVGRLEALAVSNLAC